jgi:hypothetical protein
LVCGSHAVLFLAVSTLGQAVKRFVWVTVGHCGSLLASSSGGITRFWLEELLFDDIDLSRPRRDVQMERVLRTAEIYRTLGYTEFAISFEVEKHEVEIRVFASSARRAQELVRGIGCGTHMFVNTPAPQLRPGLYKSADGGPGLIGIDTISCVEVNTSSCSAGQYVINTHTHRHTVWWQYRGSNLRAVPCAVAWARSRLHGRGPRRHRRGRCHGPHLEGIVAFGIAGRRCGSRLPDRYSNASVTWKAESRVHEYHCTSLGYVVMSIGRGSLR